MADNVLAKLKKLDEQREALLHEAKAEAMAKVEAGLQELEELGFTYELSEVGQKPKRAASTGTRTRRSGKRDAIKDALTGAPMNRASLLEHMGAKGDTKQEQSISNALTNMVKSGQLVRSEDGVYSVPTGG